MLAKTKYLIEFRNKFFLNFESNSTFKKSCKEQEKLGEKCFKIKVKYY